MATPHYKYSVIKTHNVNFDGYILAFTYVSVFIFHTIKIKKKLKNLSRVLKCGIPSGDEYNNCKYTSST
jgi:hypothetical protein